MYPYTLKNFWKLHIPISWIWQTLYALIHFRHTTVHVTCTLFGIYIYSILYNTSRNKINFNFYLFSCTSKKLNFRLVLKMFTPCLYHQNWFRLTHYVVISRNIAFYIPQFLYYVPTCHFLLFIIVLKMVCEKCKQDVL